MLCFPNCKINIGLYVTRRRDDGYHDLETVFYPLPVRDVLEAVPAAQPALHTSGLTVAGSSNDNLVWRAYELLRAELPGKVTPLDIYLHKTLPMGAGLGGGSADGAFMLRLVNDVCRLQLSQAQLADYALQLGSDCPFFIYNTPQFATGRGEQLTAITLDLSAYSIQLICPAVHVSTGAAFGKLTPRPAPFDLRTLADIPIAGWQHAIGNDFEEPAFAQHPALAAIKADLIAQGAIYASMSGSGSAIYGIFPKKKKAAITSPLAFSEFYVE